MLLRRGGIISPTLTFSGASLLVTQKTELAVVCCPSGVRGPLSFVFQPMKCSPGSPTVVTLGPALSLLQIASREVIYEGWGRGRAGSGLLVSRPQGQFTCIPYNRLASSVLPR